MLHSKPLHLNLSTWCLGVDSSKNRASLWWWQREFLPLKGLQLGTIYKSRWPLFEKWCGENSVDFSTPSVKQVTDFFVYLYQVLNRRPLTIDGCSMAIVDTLGPTGHHIPQTQTLTGYSPVFSGIFPKFQESSKWNLFCHA